MMCRGSTVFLRGMGISILSQRSMHPDMLGTRKVSEMLCAWRIGRSGMAWRIQSGSTGGMHFLYRRLNCAQQKSVFYDALRCKVNCVPAHGGEARPGLVCVAWWLAHMDNNNGRDAVAYYLLTCFRSSKLFIDAAGHRWRWTLAHAIDRTDVLVVAVTARAIDATDPELLTVCRVKV